MIAIGYYIFYLINWVFTLLPLPVLYIFSDILFLILYYFPSYRRKIVTLNLRNSFPEKSDQELRSVEKKFYHHLADLFVETLKLAHLSKANLAKRMRLTNPEVLERLYNEGRDIICVIGHYNNWEWMQDIVFFMKYHAVTIYKPLQNKQFDRFMLDLRTKNGMKLTPMSHIMRDIIEARKINRRSFYTFITDQTPPKSEIQYWTKFLNQDTPVYLGVEKVARKYDMAVVFFSSRKIRRGYYTFTAEILFEHPSGMPEYTVTEGHVRKLEELIKANPEYWIWSHRRWKHKRIHGK